MTEETADIESPAAAVLQFARALDFAARAHCDQRRKGARAEPYVNHLAEVALLTAEACGGRDRAAVLGALLHDTLEDTDTTHDELVAAFGPNVAAVVAQVTDDKNLSKAERKRRQIEHAPHVCPAAKLVKLADKISNVRSLTVSPPAGWPKSRVEEYIDWSCAVVEGLRGVSPELERRFDAAVKAARAG
jgi:GTP diphosphokinase / guanosine-3',5'-bis(diphosphate) 3'-diphosphatase